MARKKEDAIEPDTLGVFIIFDGDLGYLVVRGIEQPADIISRGELAVDGPLRSVAMPLGPQRAIEIGMSLLHIASPDLDGAHRDVLFELWLELGEKDRKRTKRKKVKKDG